MGFPIHIDTVSMGLPNVYFKGSQVDVFFKYDVFNVCTWVPLTLCILMGFPKHIDTVSMGLPNVCFKGSQVDVFFKYDVFKFLKIVDN